MTTPRVALAITLLALTAAGCHTEPRELVPGEDACAYCRMTIDDVRFGVLIVSSTGALHTFDSIECAASWVLTRPADMAPRAIWVADFDHPAQWLDVAHAHFIHGGHLASPMGRTLAAFSGDESSGTDAPSSLTVRTGGTRLSWNEVLDLIRETLDSPPPRQTPTDH